MRHCPHCRKVYDDSLNFCLTDGAPLAAGLGPNRETAETSPPVVSQVQQFTKPGVNPIFAYLSIALIVLLIGGGLVLWLKSYGTASLTANNKFVTAASPSNELLKPALNSQSNTQPQEQENPQQERQIPADESRLSNIRKNTSSPPAPAPSRLTKGAWFVVLGSYRRDESGKADQRLRYIQGLGHDATIVDSDNYPGFTGGLYCVVVGPYSKSDARGLLGRMKSAVPDAFIKSGW